MRYLITAICLAFISGLFSPAVSYAQSETESQRLVSDPGVVSYTFRHHFEEDVPATLDLIKEMGFRHIEFSNLFGRTASEIRGLLDEKGLECTSYGVGYDRLVEDTEQVIEEAHALGATHVRVAWIPHDSPFGIENARQAVEDFNRAGQVLVENGLEFSYHNHGYEFRPYADGTLFDYIVENTEAEYVNFQMDTFWTAHPGHDPVSLLERYPERFRLMHMKDLQQGVKGDYSGGAPAEYDVPLGTGQVDFPELLRAAQDSNIEYFYIEDESDDVVSRVPRSREYILSLRK